MNKNRRSYSPQMSGSPQYGSGTCQYSAPLPSTTGTYNYTVVVYPGDLTTFTGSVVIAEPDPNPTIGCNDKNGYVPENTVLNCNCTARNFGSPVGYLQILRAGNVLVMNGKEGRNVTFTIQNVTRAQDGEVLTCVLYWVQNRQSIYTMTVAYGLDNLNMSGPDGFDLNPTNPGLLTLNCMASGYKPSVTYSWTGVCVSSTSNTCTFPPTHSNNGDVINCTAINTITKEQRTSSHTMKIRFPPPTPPVITGYSGQAVNEGQAVSMTCTVNGGNPPVTSVTFVCGNKTQTSAGTSAVISITADSSRNGQTCVCSANWNNTSPPWYTLTANISIAVNYGPNNVTLIDLGEFYLHPTNHNQLTLTCEASGYNPDVTYRWSGACVSSTSKTCTFIPKESNNGDVISCTAINIVTNVQRISNSRTLIIRYPPTLSPVIANQLLYLGERVTINCTVLGGNPPVTSVTLSCGGQTQTSAGTSAFFEIIVNSSTDGQRCLCSANWENTLPPWYTLTSNVTLFVYYPPTIRQFQVNGQSGNVTVNETDRVTVTCIAEGRPTPALSLVKDGTTLDHRPQVPEYKISGIATVAHIIATANCSDAGQYVCSISSGAIGRFLYVLCSPRLDRDSSSTLIKVVISKNNNNNNNNNTPVKIPLDIVAYPKPHTFRFYFLGQNKSLSQPVASDRMDIVCDQYNVFSSYSCNIIINYLLPEYVGYYSIYIKNDLGSTAMTYYVSDTLNGITAYVQEGLSSGGVAGIVIAIFLLLIAVFTVWVWRRQWVLPCADGQASFRNQQEHQKSDIIEARGNIMFDGGTGESQRDIASAYADLDIGDMNKRSEYDELPRYQNSMIR